MKKITHTLQLHILTIITVLVGLGALAGGVIGIALSAYTLGSMDYSKKNAQAYISIHCQLLSNPLNVNDKYYVCDN